MADNDEKLSQKKTRAKRRGAEHNNKEIPKKCEDFKKTWRSVNKNKSCGKYKSGKKGLKIKDKKKHA